MYTCEVCGRKVFKKIRLGGYTLCSKHMHQLQKYGKFLDKIQRTNSDLNDYIIRNDLVMFNIYSQRNKLIGHFIIDLDDIEKVKYHKWRFSHGHVVTGLPSKGTQRDVAHIILNITKTKLENGIVVDHINGNPFDNRKSNLRICTQSKNTIGFIGISKKRNSYDPTICIGNNRWHLGLTKSLKEAVYKRYIAEHIVFKEYANKSEQRKKFEYTKDLPEETKEILKQKVIQKLKNKNLGN